MNHDHQDLNKLFGKMFDRNNTYTRNMYKWSEFI